MSRILTIPGPRAAARRARLERVTAWMAARGWLLGDYAEETATALFERPPEAAPLPWLDGTRWLPGPRPWRPAEWLPTLRADPRLLALPALVGALLAVLGLLLFGASSFDRERARRQAAAEGWHVVTTAQLHVRAGPGEQHPVVGVLYREQRVLVEGVVDATWARVGLPERGYVARVYLLPAPAAPAEDER